MRIMRAFDMMLIVYIIILNIYIYICRLIKREKKLFQFTSLGGAILGKNLLD